MKVYIASTPDINTICVAKTYEAAVKHLFRFHWINPKKKIIIDSQETTLEEFFDFDCANVMMYKWDIDMFNEFWNNDFWIKEYEVIE